MGLDFVYRVQSDSCVGVCVADNRKVLDMRRFTEICGSCKPTTPTLINWNPAQKNNEEFYAELEVDLLSRISALGLGPQKLGDSTIALTVLIETASYHIASLPVAVNIECHKHRHKTATI